MLELALRPLTTGGGEVTAIETGWRFSIPAGERGAYRLAQLDDYAGLRRGSFPWAPPLELRLRARASTPILPGTWGFGLWNDPFSFSLGLGGATRRLPALPNAVWFFFASPPNHLSIYDELPPQGALAATYEAVRIPSILLALAAPGLVPLAWPPTARPLRRLARRFIRQDAGQLKLDPSRWHEYALCWTAQQATFSLDGERVFETAITPRPPLGLVLWIDSQYAALPPDGRLSFGALESQVPGWIEIENLEIENPREISASA